MGLVVIYQAKYAARYAVSLCQERHVMIEKTNLQQMRQLICIATVVIAWLDQGPETSQDQNQKRHQKKNTMN